MKHLTEEELIEHYYSTREDEGGSQGALVQHLAECAECADSYLALERDLAEVGQVTPPARGPSYGDQVWSALAPGLPAYEAKKRRWFEMDAWKGLSYAAACALLVASAF